MKSKAEVVAEIKKHVDDKVDSGVLLRVEWVTTEILATHSDVHGSDADFYVACAVDFIKDTVKRSAGRYKAGAATADDGQIVMVGFDFMQKAYTFERSGETVLVPVDMLTDDEIEARATELEAMAKGCIAHAKELRAYRLARAA